MGRFVEVVNKRGRTVDWVDYDKAIKYTKDDVLLKTASKEEMMADNHLRITSLKNGKFALISSKDPSGNELEGVVLTGKEAVRAVKFWNATDEVQRNYKQFVINFYRTKRIRSLINIFIIIIIILAVYFSGIFLPADEQPKYVSTTGKDAKLYLQNVQYKNILIEIDLVKGREPNNGSLNDLVAFLDNICDKDQIQYVWSDIIAPAGFNENAVYSTEDLRDIERQYRDHYKKDDTVIIYIQYLNGNFSNEKDDSRVTARTYSSSSVAISIDAIKYNTEPRSVYSRENYTLHHEIGHVLGLVNFGYKSVHPHENRTDPGHCTNENCIMRQGKKVGAGYEFCEYCIDDLEKLKSNVY